MTVTILSSLELDQDVARARRAADDGPVFITDHGKPAHVLLSIEAYQRLTQPKRNIADALAMPDLAMPDLADIPFDPPRADIATRPADLS